MKIQSFFYFLLSVLLTYIVFLIPMGCANPVGTLTGGAKDITPPKIDSLKSTPNPSINFNEKEIILTFDEWLKLEDAFNQIVVSPPLDNRLDIKLKGKSVRINIDEKDTLKENTTYIINFGTAIKDLTESNVPPNLKYVFSTGDVIDSLETRGQVFDVVSGKGEPNVLVMLYKNLEDSIVRKEKPYYFAKTDKDGNFKIEYLKAGTYKAVALIDNNFNYLFDLPNEKIGFMEEPIVVTDTSNLILSFKIFEEEPPLIITDQELRQLGVIKLIFNKEPDDVQADLSDFNGFSHMDFSKDTMLIWYTETDSSLQKSIPLFLEKEEFYDTITFKIPVKKDALALAVLTKSKNINLSPKDSFIMEFGLPISELDTSLFSITEDSVNYVGLKNMVITEDPRKVRFDFERKEEKTYEFTILPNAIKDIFGNTTDTLVKTVKALPLSEFGDMSIKVEFPDSTIQYIVSLLDSKGQEIGEFQVADVASFDMKFTTLPSGAYKVKVIEDTNANGRRDSGSYDEKRQPERIYEKQLEELKKSWELETVVKVVF